MKLFSAKIIFALSLGALAISSILTVKKIDPFFTLYFLFAWWSYIGMADSWLYMKGGGSFFVEHTAETVFFLVPFSAFLWFVFEAFNLRLHNWHYINVPADIWIRWPGNFLAFGTVLPGIFLTANLLEHYGVFRRNEFSRFFPNPIAKITICSCMAAGLSMLALPLAFPRYFFPLVWGGFALLLDPLNALWNGQSLLQEWMQKNWNRTLQLLLAGLICGGLWEFWNFWAGAKWIYSVPLPVRLLGELKIFEMPLLGFIGFPPFALECFVMTEFAKNARERMPAAAWKCLVLAALLFSVSMCALMDIHTVVR